MLACWKAFEAAALRGLTPEQLNSARTTFYSGGSAVFALMMRIVEAGEDGDLMATRVGALEQEFEDYRNEVMIKLRGNMVAQQHGGVPPMTQ